MLNSKLASTALVASSYCRVATLHRLDSTRGNANQPGHLSPSGLITKLAILVICCTRRTIGIFKSSRYWLPDDIEVNMGEAIAIWIRPPWVTCLQTFFSCRAQTKPSRISTRLAEVFNKKKNSHSHMAICLSDGQWYPKSDTTPCIRSVLGIRFGGASIKSNSIDCRWRNCGRTVFRAPRPLSISLASY